MRRALLVFAVLALAGCSVRLGLHSTSTHHSTHHTARHKTSVIMTLNMVSEDYAGTRDFAVADTGRSDIGAIGATFNADFAHQAITPPDGADLVWSPTNSQSAILYIHAKAVVADAGRKDQQVFAGSENFSTASLDDNRELGIRTANAAVVSAISATLAGDYAAAKAYPAHAAMMRLGPQMSVHVLSRAMVGMIVA